MSENTKRWSIGDDPVDATRFTLTDTEAAKYRLQFSEQGEPLLKLTRTPDGKVHAEYDPDNVTAAAQALMNGLARIQQPIPLPAPTTDQLAAIEAPLPDDARMEAYYYAFERTGIGAIDAILSAVAIAGKGSHHTESWSQDHDYGYYKNRPGLPDAASAVDLIQSTADLASRNVTKLLALVREQAAKLEAVRELADEWSRELENPEHLIYLESALDATRAALDPTP